MNSVSDEQGQFPVEDGAAGGDATTTAPTETQPASYYDVFPALSKGSTKSSWFDNNKLRVVSSTITQRLVIAPAERRRKAEKTDFGKDNSTQKIMNQTNTRIELSQGKDGTLTFLVSGKPNDVNQALKQVVAEYQAERHDSIEIPKEYHSKILGKSGAKLKELEQQTGCRIAVPNINDNSNTITVTGPEPAIREAIAELTAIHENLYKSSSDRFEVPQTYHPFIVGPNFETLNRISSDYQVNIKVPYTNVKSDLITIKGSKEAVQAAKEAVLKIYHEMEARCKQVSVEVPRSQHKYILGRKGTTLAEILKETGVSVELPPEGDSITLRGPQEKLGLALTMVWSKATSMKQVKISAPLQLHKRLRVKKNSLLSDLDPQVRVNFNTDDANDCYIEIEGPADPVNQLEEEFKTEIQQLTSSLHFDQITVDASYTKHIIGKKGSRVKSLKEDTGVDQINISENGNTAIIQIEGTPEAVKKAKAEIMEIVNKLKNEKEIGINVDMRLIRHLGRLKEVREKFPRVVILPPPEGEKGEVKLRGPNDAVEECAKHIRTLARELAEENATLNIPVFKGCHKFVIGKKGAVIRQIREETNTDIILPSESDDSCIIQIIGPQKAVEEAKERILKIQEEWGNVVKKEFAIPADLLKVGQVIRSICHDLRIRIDLPKKGGNSDVAILVGDSEDIERAIQQIQDLAKQTTIAEMNVKQQHHRFLIGKKGSTVRQIREMTGANIIIPPSNTDEPIYIFGKENEVSQARQELERIVTDLDNTVEEYIDLDQQYHKHFIANRGQINATIEDSCAVRISFPRLQNGGDPNKVLIKGYRSGIDQAKKQIEDEVNLLKSVDTICIEIDRIHHGAIMGKRGSRIRAIEQAHNVRVKVGTPRYAQSEHGEESAEIVNGNSNDANLVKITGQPEDCEEAKKEILACIPKTIEVAIPRKLHVALIGQKNARRVELQKDFNVDIKFPAKEEDSDIIKIIGPQAQIDAAKEELLKLVEELELQSYNDKIELDPQVRTKIFGRIRNNLFQIRDDCGVQLSLPFDDNVIILTGYQDKVEAAKEKVDAFIKSLDDLICVQFEVPRNIHARLIGTKRRHITKLMSDFDVDVDFAKSEDSNPNLVTIIGQKEDDVLDAQDAILDRAKDFRVPENEITTLQEPTAAEFKVTGAPWDVESIADFPTFGAKEQQTGNGPIISTWGPRR